MSMTMQRVDDRHHQSLPLFYPDYKPGSSLKSRSSKDVQFYEGSPRSSRSPSTQRGNHKSSRQHWESNPSRPSETSLKSCLRKPSDKHAVNKENFKDSDNDTKGGHFKEIENNRKVGGFRDNDDDRSFTATDNRNKFPIKKWRAKKVEQKDSVDDCKENRENVKMKGFSYPRFRYPLRFHYGSGTQSKSVTVSAIPAGFRTSSFYSSLPRRQRQVEPGSLSSGNNRRGKDDKQKHGTKPSPEKKTEMENEKNSRTPSPERELNGVYHVVHETETIQVIEDTELEEKQKSKTTDEDNTWTTTDQSDDDDDKALEVKDKITDGSNRRSPRRSSHSNRSEESIKEAGSSSDEARLKIEDDSSDDEDLRRSKKKEKRKNMKKKRNGDKDKTETKKYAADFDENSSGVLSVD